ncbi:MAG TPA: ATP-binding protein [Acidobacteriota bacterium]|nr:ATP-binding protein [Acidobacteriota bacterium]HQG91305.1 ATP-binding protein [Acidobacteriota bacterium]HQK87251.1 ATP-binding protein [Acidobacteriota bacterium]
MPKHELIRMRFSSEVLFIDIAQEVVQKILENLKVIEDEIFWICLAVREAVINAVKHGNNFDAGKYVDFVVDIQGEQLRIEVADQGTGFNIDDVPDPLSDENILKPSGRGIFYIRSFMDNVDYEIVQPSGTRLVMLKKLTIPAGERA